MPVAWSGEGCSLHKVTRLDMSVVKPNIGESTMSDDIRKEQQLTLAELCQAIDDGRVDYTLRDGCYQVRPAAARRLRLDIDPALVDVLSSAARQASNLEFTA